ncbi:ABC transporter ATP-binding protein [unidentified eubacterium SCB49]|nr:ABC transporter ATP-binding protein [unidentified eubacterium SCB49]
MKQLLFKTVIFSIIFLLLLFFIDKKYYRLKNEPFINSVMSLEDAPKDSYEIVFFGSSHLYRGIEPAIIKAKTGINNTVVHGGGTHLGNVYYDIIESLKYHSPKLIVIETWPLYSPSPINNNFLKDGKMTPVKASTLYGKKPGFNKLEQAFITYGKETPYHFLNTFIFHENWKNLTKWKKDIDQSSKLTAEEIYYKRPKKYDILDIDKVEKYTNFKFKNNQIYLSSTEKTYLDKINKLAQKNNFSLLFITVPVYKEYTSQTVEGYRRVQNELKEYIKPYPNMSIWSSKITPENIDRTYIINERKINSNQHLNNKGTTIISCELADYILEKYPQLEKKNGSPKFVEEFIYKTPNQKPDDLNSVVHKLNYINDPSKNDLIYIDRSDKVLKISGCFFNKKIDNKSAKKFVILKRDDNFALIFDRLFKGDYTRVTKEFGEAFSHSTYSKTIDLDLLLDGNYEIIHVLESNEKKYFYEYTGYKIKIE